MGFKQGSTVETGTTLWCTQRASRAQLLAGHRGPPTSATTQVPHRLPRSLKGGHYMLRSTLAAQRTRHVVGGVQRVCGEVHRQASSVMQAPGTVGPAGLGRETGKRPLPTLLGLTGRVEGAGCLLLRPGRPGMRTFQGRTAAACMSSKRAGPRIGGGSPLPAWSLAGILPGAVTVAPTGSSVGSPSMLKIVPCWDHPAWTSL